MLRLDAASPRRGSDGPRPGPRRADQQVQQPPIAGRRASSSRRSSRRRIASRWRCDSTACWPRRASRRGSRASRSTSAALLYTPSGKPRVAIISIAHLDDAERMFFVSLLLNQMRRRGCAAQRGTSSLRALHLHGRDLRLPPAGGEPAVEGAAADAAQAGAGVRARRACWPRRTRSTWITRRCRTPARGCSAGCRPNATRRACSMDWKGPPPAPAGLRSRERSTSCCRRSASACSCCTTCTRRRRWCSRRVGAVVPARPARREELRRLTGRRRTPARPHPRASAASAATTNTAVAQRPRRHGGGAARAGAGERRAPDRAARTCRGPSAPATARPGRRVLLGAARISYADTKLGIDETRDVVVYTTEFADGPVCVDWEHAEPADFRSPT